MENGQLATSPYNLRPDLLAALNLPDRVAINDVTLREGEQTAGVSFTLEQKIELARRLDDVGVSQIQIGWPGKSQMDREVLRLLKEEKLRAPTQALATLYGKAWQAGVDASVESGADIVSLLHATSDIRLKYAEKMSRDALLAKLRKGVRYAAGRGPLIAFSIVDATRTDLDFLKQVVEEVVAAGAERISVSDTAGGATPATMRYLVSRVVEWSDVPVQAHCHNDFGLALANLLAAVEGGATIVDASINGLGERSGNPSLDEVAVALHLLYGVETRVKLDKLFSLSQYVKEITGVPLPFNKPLVGENAFAHKLDIHVRRLMICAPLFEPLPPEMVGNSRLIPLERETGPAIVEYKLRERGLEANEEQIGRIVSTVRERASKKGASLTEQEFTEIIEAILG